MAEEVSFGVRRLRQAITNQATCGSGQFELSIDSADKLCRECEDELSRLSWAEGVPAPVDADGEVVPLTTLTTRAMYTHSGKKIGVNADNPLSYDPNTGEWFIFFDGAVKDRLTALHLHRPDSWERLEEDVELAPRDYLQSRGMDPEKTERVKAMMADLVSRAKALAERDAKEAERG